jgi:HPt (histidine-containing phosphotransfer) domain-containing protein
MMEGISAQDHALLNGQLTSLDRAIALERVGGDAELLQEVARLFIDDYPNSMKSIRAAIDAHDAKALERAAHNLKGAVANFGAQATVQAALRLEQIGRAGRVEGAEQAFATLAVALEQLTPELTALADGSLD